MNTNTTKLFNTNNELIDTFELEVENVLKSIYGDNYYDIDEEFIVKETDNQEITIENEKKKKISIKDFIPLLFFILIFIIIVIAGYYFLNHFDLTSIL